MNKINIFKMILEGIKQGIEASDKKSGRKKGKLDKMTLELELDIKDTWL